MPSPPTRRALLTVGTTALAGLAGCIGGGPDATDGTTPTTADGTSTRSTTPQTVSTTDEGLPPSKTAMPTGDPVSVEETIEDVEYLDSQDAVRYVAAWRAVEDGNGSEPTREPVHETAPFEEWAATKCRTIAAHAAMEAVRERLDGTGDGIGTGVGTVDGSDEGRVHVTYRTTLDSDGDVVSEPSVPFEDVVAVAPEQVTATVTLAGRSHTCTEQVVVQRLVVKEM